MNLFPDNLGSFQVFPYKTWHGSPGIYKSMGAEYSFSCYTIGWTVSVSSIPLIFSNTSVLECHTSGTWMSMTAVFFNTAGSCFQWRRLYYSTSKPTEQPNTFSKRVETLLHVFFGAGCYKWKELDQRMHIQVFWCRINHEHGWQKGIEITFAELNFKHTSWQDFARISISHQWLFQISMKTTFGQNWVRSNLWQISA